MSTVFFQFAEENEFIHSARDNTDNNSKKNKFFSINEPSKKKTIRVILEIEIFNLISEPI